MNEIVNNLNIFDKVTLVMVKDMNDHAVHGSVFNIEDINGGDCYNWAAIVKKIIPSAQLCTVGLHGGHAFVKINDRYYDAENTKGVKDWKKLSVLIGDNTSDRDMEIQSEDEFYKEWRINKRYIGKMLTMIGKMK